MSGSANNGWEDSSRGVIASKASFTHTRTVVNNKSRDVVVTHID
jgi:hypothetical protein